MKRANGLAILGVIVLLVSIMVGYPKHATGTTRLQFQQSLLQLIVPVGSVWPPYYAHLSLNYGYANVGLGALVRDLVAGLVELRSPGRARDVLLCSDLDLNGCKLRFFAELHLWTSTLCFLVRGELTMRTCRVR